MSNENRDICMRIRDELTHYFNGEMYRCPECGEQVIIQDVNTMYYSSNTHKLPCGCSLDDTDAIFLSSLSLYDYIDKTYGHTYYVSSDKKEVEGVRIMVAGGGPSIFIDTYRKEIELFWWNDHCACGLDLDVCDAITDIYSETFSS